MHSPKNLLGCITYIILFLRQVQFRCPKSCQSSFPSNPNSDALWELLYAKALILMHNIDVMHQERNVGEMAFADKTKDNQKARKDLAQLCNQASFELKSSGGKPRVCFI
jgi:hypothetical protein